MAGGSLYIIQARRERGRKERKGNSLWRTRTVKEGGRLKLRKDNIDIRLQLRQIEKFRNARRRNYNWWRSREWLLLDGFKQTKTKKERELGVDRYLSWQKTRKIQEHRYNFCCSGGARPTGRRKGTKRLVEKIHQRELSRGALLRLDWRTGKHMKCSHVFTQGKGYELIVRNGIPLREKQNCLS